MNEVPVADAEVRAVLVDESVAARVARGYPPNSEILNLVEFYRSDSDGYVVIPSPPQILAVGVRAKGAQLDGMYFDPETEGECTSELRPELTVSGVVRFEDGTPAPGAVVEASIDFYHRRRAWFAGYPLPLSHIGLWLFSSKVTTNERGEFQLDRLGIGPITLRASLTGYSTSIDPEVMVPQQKTASLTLYRSACVRGFVFDTNSQIPVAGALVRAATPRAPYYPDAYHDQTYAERDGSFQLPAIPAERANINVVVSQDGYASKVIPLDAAAIGSIQDMEIELTPAAPVFGSVVSALDETPVPAASITFYSRPDLHRIDKVLSMPDGTFATESLAPDTAYSAVVYHPNFERLTLRSVTTSDESLQVRMRPLGQITGTVTTGGDPVDSGQIRITRLAATDELVEERWQEIGHGGRFSFDGLAAGNYSLQAMPDGYAITRLSPIVVSPDRTDPTDVDLELKPQATLWGVVTVKDTEEPVVGATVRVADLLPSGVERSSLHVETTTDDMGRYTLGQLPIGERVGIVVEKELFASSMTPVSIPANKARTQLDFALEAGASIQVRIMNSDGSPLLRIRAHSYQAGRPSQYNNSDDGVARLDNLLPGKWSIQATATKQSVAPRSFYGMTFCREVTLSPGESLDLAFTPSERGTVHGIITGDTTLLEGRHALALNRANNSPRHFDSFNNIIIGDEFWLHGLAPGRHYIWIQTNDYGDQIMAGADIEVSANEVSEVTIDLGESSMFGRVVGPGGKPVCNARIGMALANSLNATSNNGFGRHSADSGTDGSYSVIGLHPDTYRCTASADGFAKLETEVTIAIAEHVVERDFQLQPEATLEATVLSPSGTRIPDASIELRSVTDSNRNTIRSSAADADAVFRFEQLAGERYEVIAKSGALFPAIAVVDLVAGANHTVTLQLRDRGDLAVRVASIEGPAVPNAPVILRDSYGATSADWRQRGWIEIGDEGLMTDNMGACLIRGVPAGKLSIEAMFTTMTVTVEPAETTKANITLLE